VLVLSATGAMAQDRFEIQPFIGYKFGGGIDIGPNPLGITRVNFNSGVAGGVSATFNATPNLGLEFLWNRQATKVVGQINATTDYAQTVDATLDQFHGNFIITLTERESKLKPFVLFGLGATHGGAGGSSSTKFSFGLGGGVKYFFSEHMGVRAQIRYAPTYLYSTAGGLYCGWWGFCWTVPDDHYLNQGDVTIGWVLRF